MQLKITKKEEKPLLARSEVSAELSYDAVTPNRQETKKALAKELKAAEETLVIKTIKPVFGERMSIVTAEVYRSAEDAKRVASKVYIARDSGQSGKKKEKTEEKSETKSA